MYFNPQPKAPRRKKKKHTVPIAIASRVWQRDKYTCRMCGTVCAPEYRDGYRLAWGPHHIEHRSQGGKDVVGNLITFCNHCHEPRAHKFYWTGVPMGKMEFMGKCYTIIESDYPASDLPMAYYRVWARRNGEIPWKK